MQQLPFSFLRNFNLQNAALGGAPAIYQQGEHAMHACNLLSPLTFHSAVSATPMCLSICSLVNFRGEIPPWQACLRFNVHKLSQELISCSPVMHSWFVCRAPGKQLAVSAGHGEEECSAAGRNCDPSRCHALLHGH